MRRAHEREEESWMTDGWIWGKRGGEIEVVVAFLYVHTEGVCDS